MLNIQKIENTKFFATKLDWFTISQITINSITVG